MSMSPRMEGRQRLVGFRLSDVPEPVRLSAKDKLLRAEGRDLMVAVTRTFEERLAIGLAAEQPSDRVYWITREAWDRARQKRAWRLA